MSDIICQRCPGKFALSLPFLLEKEVGERCQICLVTVTSFADLHDGSAVHGRPTPPYSACAAARRNPLPTLGCAAICFAGLDVSRFITGARLFASRKLPFARLGAHEEHWPNAIYPDRLKEKVLTRKIFTVPLLPKRHTWRPTVTMGRPRVREVQGGIPG